METMTIYGKPVGPLDVVFLVGAALIAAGGLFWLAYVVLSIVSDLRAMAGKP